MAVAERALESGEVMACDVVVGDDAALFRTQPLGNQRTGARQQAGADQHVIGAAGQGHRHDARREG